MPSTLETTTWSVSAKLQTSTVATSIPHPQREPRRFPILFYKLMSGKNCSPQTTLAHDSTFAVSRKVISKIVFEALYTVLQQTSKVFDTHNPCASAPKSTLRTARSTQCATPWASLFLPLKSTRLSSWATARLEYHWKVGRRAHLQQGSIASKWWAVIWIGAIYVHTTKR